MALPKMTDEQRTEALAKAAETRAKRAELKKSLKSGNTNLREVLVSRHEDPVVGRMRVLALLKSLPSIGEVKAKEIMREFEISDTRRVQGLGDRQVEKLQEFFTI